MFTLQTLPACEQPFDDGMDQVAGFSLHAGVAAKADQRKKLERLSEGGPAATLADRQSPKGDCRLPPMATSATN